MTARSATLPSPDDSDAAGADRALDWELAAATADRLMGHGPQVARSEAVRAVRELRRASAEAETHVRELTGLGLDLPVLQGDVVDRREWVRAAARGLSELTGTALRSADGTRPLGADLLGGVGVRGAGIQAGVVLSYLGTKVLGQYDPFLPGEAGTDPGRLLLVAPNIVAAQQSLGVPADDFTMWVCLHESTHRLQFNAVPWLRDHFASSIGVLLSDMDSSMSDLLGRLPSVVRGVRSGEDVSPGVLGVVELLQGPEQRAALDRILALSTLLEGHADHVMDAVGPRVVPSVDVIRRRFTERRKGGGLLDRLLRSLLGVDAKIRQYAEGAEFTRQVVQDVGMDGFNAVWNSPEQLPSRAEITDPAAWVRRVHG